MITQYEVSQATLLLGRVATLDPPRRFALDPSSLSACTPAKGYPLHPLHLYKHRPPMFIKMIKGAAFISGGVLLLHLALRLCLNNPTESCTLCTPANGYAICCPNYRNSFFAVILLLITKSLFFILRFYYSVIISTPRSVSKNAPKSSVMYEIL